MPDGIASVPAGARSTTDNYKWLLVGMLWLVSFFNYADRNALAAVLPQIRAEYGMTDTELGLLSSSFLWVYAIAASPAGWLGDRFSRKAVILAGLVAWSVVTFLTPFAGGLMSFVVLRALTGLGEASYYPAGTALIGDHHGPETRSRALAIHQTAVFAGGGIGSLIAAALAERFDWRVPYYAYGLLGVALAAVLFWSMRDGPRAERRPAAQTAGGRGADTLRVVLRSPSAVMLCAVFFCATFVTAGITAWAPTFFKDVLRMSLTGATVYGALTVNVAGFLAVLCSGALADWAVRRSRTARFSVLAAGLILAALALLPFGLFASAGLLGGLLLAAGFFKGLFDGSIYAAMHDVVPPEARATAVGLMTTIGFAGAGLAPLAIGAAAGPLGLGRALAATAVLYLVAAAVLLLFRRQVARDMSRAAQPISA